MPDGYLHLLLAPSEGAEEPVELDLADGLEAKPLRADVARVLVLQCVHVDASFSLRPARLYRPGDDVQLLFLDHPRPVLLYLLAHHVAVGAHLVFPELPLALMLVLVGQAAGYVADFLRLQAMEEPHVQQDARAGMAARIAIGLLQAVILLHLACLRVVSYLGGEIHAAKIGIKFYSAVFYIEVLAIFGA